MTSKMVSGCIFLAKENNSTLFACFLDIQKALDEMWLYKVKVTWNRYRIAYLYMYMYCSRGINRTGLIFFKAHVRVEYYHPLCFML